MVLQQRQRQRFGSSSHHQLRHTCSASLLASSPLSSALASLSLTAACSLACSLAPQLWSESHEALALGGQQHYVRGGKPGYFPPLKGNFPHPVPFNFFDPFNLSTKATPERKEQG